MDLSRRGLQTNVKLLTKLKIRFRIIGRKPKNEILKKKIYIYIYKTGREY